MVRLKLKIEFLVSLTLGILYLGLGNWRTLLITENSNLASTLQQSKQSVINETILQQSKQNTVITHEIKDNEYHTLLQLQPLPIPELNSNFTPIILYQTMLWFDKEQVELDKDTPNAKKLIQDIDEIITQHPNIIIEINGHADRSGPMIEHQRLSIERANNTAKFIRQELSLEENKMRIKSFGSNQPLDQGMDCTAHARNRRVELLVKSEGKHE